MSNSVRYPSAFQNVQDPRNQIIQQSMIRNQGSTLNQMLKETQLLGQENQQQPTRLLPSQQQQLHSQQYPNQSQQQIGLNQQPQSQGQSQQLQSQQQSQQQRNTADRIRLSMQSPRIGVQAFQNNIHNNQAQQQQNQPSTSTNQNGITQIQNQNVNSTNIGTHTSLSNKKVTPIVNSSPHTQIQGIKNNFVEEKDLNLQQTYGNNQNNQSNFSNTVSNTQKPLFESQILKGASNNQKIAGQRKSSLFVPPTSQQQNSNYFNSVQTQPIISQNSLPQNGGMNNMQQNQEGQIQQLHKQRSFHQLHANGNQNQVQIVANTTGTLPLQNMTNVLVSNQQQQQQQGITQQQYPFIIQVEEGVNQLANQPYIVSPPLNQNIYASPNGPSQSLRQSQVFPNLKQQQQQQSQQQQQVLQQQNQISQSQILLPIQQQQQQVGSPMIQLLNSPNKQYETELSTLDLEQQQYYINQLQAQQIQQLQQQQPQYLIQQNQQELQNNSYIPQPIPQVGSPTNSASQKAAIYKNQQIVAINQQQYPSSMNSSQINMNQPNSNNTGSSRLKQLYNSPQNTTMQQNGNVLHNSRFVLQQQSTAPIQVGIQQLPSHPAISQITLNDQSNSWSTQNLPNTQTTQEKNITKLLSINEQYETENRQLKNKNTQLEEQQKETQLQYVSQQSYLQDLEKKIKMLIQQNEKLQQANEGGTDKSELIINQLKGERDQLKEEIQTIKQTQQQQNQYNEEQIRVLVSNLETKMHELVVENERINNILSSKYQEIDQLQKIQEQYTQLQRQNNIYNHLINEGQNEYKLKISNLETENGELKLTVKELRSRIKQSENIPDLELVVKDFEQKINQLVEENNRLNSIIEDLEHRLNQQQQADGQQEEKQEKERQQKIFELTLTNKEYKEQIDYWKKKCVEMERKKLNESLSQKDSNPSSLQNSASKQSNNSINNNNNNNNETITQKSEQTNEKAQILQNSRIKDLETKLNYVLQENEKLNNILTEQISITQSLAKSSANLKQQKQQKQQTATSNNNNLNTGGNTSSTISTNNNENVSEQNNE